MVVAEAWRAQSDLLICGEGEVEGRVEGEGEGEGEGELADYCICQLWSGGHPLAGGHCVQVRWICTHATPPWREHGILHSFGVRPWGEQP